MSAPIIYCDPIWTSAPKCVSTIFIETDVPNTQITIRIKKFNNNVRYFDVTTDNFGFAEIDIDNWFGYHDGVFLVTAKDLLNNNVYFISNFGYHDELRLEIEDSQNSSQSYVLNQNIVVVCCEKTINCIQQECDGDKFFIRRA